MAFDGAVEVGEFQRVAQEKHGRVVADQVPVAFLGVELHCEAPDVALGVGRAALAGDSEETHCEIGLLTDLREDLRLRVLRHVVGHHEGAKRTRALRMHTALWDHFACEVRKLFEMPDIL